MTLSSNYSTLVFDIGDVLFSWSSKTQTSLSSKILKRILSSSIWFDYERGRITQQICYHRVEEEFSVDHKEFGQALDEAKDSLQSNDELISVIRELKAQSGGKLRVLAMSNISSLDFDVLRSKPADWSIFDDIFISGNAGERKPHASFYKHVMEKAQLDPQNGIIFIDDKFENILQARCLGWHGIVFDNTPNVIRQLRNLLGDPISRGQAYLHRNAKQLHSMTDTGIILEENFAQLLILEASGNKDLVHLVEEPRYWNFFSGKPQLTTESFPVDLDTTALGFTVIPRDGAIVSSVMDEMLDYRNEDGIVEMYFDHSRPRIDPVVCVNVLTLFYTYGRGKELSECLDWVRQVLISRAYVEGTRYYTAEDFLFLLTRLIGCSDSLDLHGLVPLLKERIQERVGTGGDALALAMRILTCQFVGIRNEADLRDLLPLQCDDGGWEIGWMYKYSGGIRIGNRGYTTALAVKAIEIMTKPSESQSWCVVV